VPALFLGKGPLLLPLSLLFLHGGLAIGSLLFIHGKMLFCLSMERFAMFVHEKVYHCLSMEGLLLSVHGRFSFACPYNDSVLFVHGKVLYCLAMEGSLLFVHGKVLCCLSKETFFIVCPRFSHVCPWKILYGLSIEYRRSPVVRWRYSISICILCSQKVITLNH
jgi:hypothetical protein